MKRDLKNTSGDFPAGLSNPARRALKSAGIHQLEHLAKFSQAEIEKLHGIGPNAMGKLQAALQAAGLDFKAERI